MSMQGEMGLSGGSSINPREHPSEKVWADGAGDGDDPHPDDPGQYSLDIDDFDIDKVAGRSNN